MVSLSKVILVTPVGVPSTIFAKSFHPSVALYTSIFPVGTYSIAFIKVFWLNVPPFDKFPYISNGFSINDTTVVRFSQLNASLPMFVTLLGMVMEVRL